MSKKVIIVILAISLLIGLIITDSENFLWTIFSFIMNGLNGLGDTETIFVEEIGLTFSFILIAYFHYFPKFLVFLIFKFLKVRNQINSVQIVIATQIGLVTIVSVNVLKILCNHGWDNTLLINALLVLLLLGKINENIGEIQSLEDANKIDQRLRDLESKLGENSNQNF